MKDQSLEQFDITLAPGSIYNLQLAGSSSGGYQWDYSVVEGKELVKVSEEAVVPPKKEAEFPSTFEAGLIFRIEPLEAGKVLIRFFLHRAWESNKLPIREKLLSITIPEKTE